MGYVRGKIGLTGQFDRHQPGHYLQPRGLKFFIIRQGVFPSESVLNQQSSSFSLSKGILFCWEQMNIFSMLCHKMSMRAPFSKSGFTNGGI